MKRNRWNHEIESVKWNDVTFPGGCGVKCSVYITGCYYSLNGLMAEILYFDSRCAGNGTAKLTSITGIRCDRNIVLSDRFSATIQEVVDRFKIRIVDSIDDFSRADMKLRWPASNFVSVGDEVIIDDRVECPCCPVALRGSRAIRQIVQAGHIGFIIAFDQEDHQFIRTIGS